MMSIQNGYTLDKSGIRWRVIVISACYSGSFVPALQDDNTLIITASAATGLFRCSNEPLYVFWAYGHATASAFDKPNSREKANLTSNQWSIGRIWNLFRIGTIISVTSKTEKIETLIKHNKEK